MRATHSVAPGSASYAKGTYWDDRYAERETNFDWFFTYQALRELIADALGHTKALPCLHVGCGNSTLQLGMASDGFTVCNVSPHNPAHGTAAGPCVHARACADRCRRQDPRSAPGAPDPHLSPCASQPTTPSPLQVDISEVVIEQLQRQHRGVQALSYHAADCRCLPHWASGSFGSVLDKGTLDAVLCW